MCPDCKKGKEEKERKGEGKEGRETMACWREKLRREQGDVEGGGAAWKELEMREEE